MYAMYRNIGKRTTAGLLALALLLLQAGALGAQPFVEITSTTGGMYACEGLPMAVVAFPAQGFKGQGRWVVSHPDVLKTDGNVVALQPKQAGSTIQLTYELRLNDGTKLDTTITLTARTTTHVDIEQQGDKLVVLGKNGHPAPAVYQWRVNGVLTRDYYSVPFDHPESGKHYSVKESNSNVCLNSELFVVK